MILVSTFASVLEQILNGTYNATTITHTATRPSVYFKVRTPFTYLDNVRDDDTKENFIPVIIGESSGEFESIPGANLCDQSYTAIFYFPVEMKEDIFAIIEYLSEAFVGQYLNFGTTLSPKMVATNMDVASFGQVSPQNFGEFEQLCNGLFHKKVERTKLYGIMMLPINLSSGGSGISFGNAIKYKLSIDNGSHYYEVKRFDNSSNYNGQPNSQQLLNGMKTETSVDSSVYVESISFLYESNSLCSGLYTLFKNQTIQNTPIKVQKSVDGGTNWETYTKVITTLDLVERIGLPRSFTITMTDKVNLS